MADGTQDLGVVSCLPSQTRICGHSTRLHELSVRIAISVASRSANEPDGGKLEHRVCRIGLGAPGAKRRPRDGIYTNRERQSRPQKFANAQL